VSLVTRVLADGLAEGYGMMKEEAVERVTAPPPRRGWRAVPPVVPASSYPACDG